MNRGSRQREWTAPSGGRFLLWLDPLEDTPWAILTFVPVERLQDRLLRRVPAETDLEGLSDKELVALLERPGL